MKKIIVTLLLGASIYAGPNQTDQVSPVLTGAPFRISIDTAGFTVPGGIQSTTVAQNGYEYLFIAGRTNGLHDFANTNDFPPQKQNTNVIVVNTNTQTVHMRSLYDKKSGLSQRQIDSLSVTSPQFYQSGNTLYITGGYGVDSDTGNFSTKDKLTAINVSGLIHWVKNPSSSFRAIDFIRQISDPVFQVTGGQMYQYGQSPTLLIFGQNFIGQYNTSSNGIYTRQVRRFHIIDDGNNLGVNVLEATPQREEFRRRDLNIIPIIKTGSGRKVPAFVALSGVFTLDTGIWTVPVEITADGTPSMADPNAESTFKQAMNNYDCAHVELLAGNGDMYSVLFGGLSFGYFEDGQFQTSSDIPFINQVTAIHRTSDGEYEQLLLPVEYPAIESTQSNPGNILRFGAGAEFITAPNLPIFSNGVLDLEKINGPTVIGYIVGGIQSTLANTNVPSDSAASPHIFRVTLNP